MTASQLKLELHQTIDGLNEKKLKEVKKLLNSFLNSISSKPKKVSVSDEDKKRILEGIKDFENGDFSDAYDFLFQMKKKYV